MAAVGLSFRGLDELRAALRALPDDLTNAAGPEVIGAADDAAAEILAAYPEGPGDDEREGGSLRRGVKVVKASAGRFGAAAQVRSTSPHALIFERGTQARHTALGYNRGAMPAANIFVPIVVRRRKAMYGALTRIVERAGFTIRE